MHMKYLQDMEELKRLHIKPDPGTCEAGHDDIKRKTILLSELPQKKYLNVLNIGCGQGFITRDLPGNNITGIDISRNAIANAEKFSKPNIKFIQGSIFELPDIIPQSYDLIAITGVLYPQYIGKSLNLVYIIIDKLLQQDGILACVHINDGYKARFPYILIKNIFYLDRDSDHNLEIYTK